MADQSAEATVGREVKQSRLKPMTPSSNSLCTGRREGEQQFLCRGNYRPGLRDRQTERTMLYISPVRENHIVAAIVPQAPDVIAPARDRWLGGASSTKVSMEGIHTS